MADAGIKKATIKYADLPNISVDEDGPFYSIRYRVVSEDKNRVSHWSEIARINFPSTSLANMPYTSTDRIHLNRVGSSIETIMVSWNFPSIDDFDPDQTVAKYEKIFSTNDVFDIFIRWNPNNAPDNINWSEWFYEGNIGSYTFNVLKPDPLSAPYSYTPKQIQLAVQIPAVIKEYNSNLSLFRITGNI